MEYKAFFSRIGQGISGGYYFHGVEEYVKRSALQQLAANFDPQELNVQTLYAPAAQDVIAACETLPFFAEQRLIVCRDWAQKEEKALADYFPRVPESTVLILYRTGKADARTALFQSVKKLNRDVDFCPLSEADATRWLLQQAVKRAGILEPSVARHIVTLVGVDVNALHNELEKLLAYAGPGNPITREAVSACVLANVEYRLFDTLDDLLSGRTAEGLRALYSMLEERTTRPTAAAALLAGQCKNLLGAKLLLEAGVKNEKDIASRLNCKPFVAQKSLRMCRRYSVERLKTALRAFADVDYRIKTGQAQERPALEAAIFEALRS